MKRSIDPFGFNYTHYDGRSNLTYTPIYIWNRLFPIVWASVLHNTNRITGQSDPPFCIRFNRLPQVNFRFFLSKGNVCVFVWNHLSLVWSEQYAKASIALPRALYRNFIFKSQFPTLYSLFCSRFFIILYPYYWWRSLKQDVTRFHRFAHLFAYETLSGSRARPPACFIYVDGWWVIHFVSNG